MIEIHTLELGQMDNFIYLIEDCETHQAAVVDPAWDAVAITRYAEQKGLKISAILLTHGHHDHINAVEPLQQLTGATVYVHQREALFFKMQSFEFVAFEAGFILPLGESEVEAVETPGHTPGGVCYSAGEHLVTGDTLFVFGCGRCDLEGGDPRQMYQSLKQLVASFAPSTRIYPGHNYSVQSSSTLAEEVEGNPFLACSNEESFVHYRMVEHDRVRNSPYGAVI